MTNRTGDVVLKLDAVTGKQIWVNSSDGVIAYLEGKFFYTVSYLNPTDEEVDGGSSTASSRVDLPPPTKIHDVTDISLSDRIASMSTKTIEYAKPFQYLNLGILAYTGRNTALAQVATAPKCEPLLATGFIGSELWKGIYLWKQVSWRNRIMVVSDWLKRRIFGRDITHLE